jgi:hypothetical protein
MTTKSILSFLSTITFCMIISGCSLAGRYLPGIVPGESITDNSWIPLNIKKTEVPQEYIARDINPDQQLEPMEKIDLSELGPPGSFFPPEMFIGDPQIFGGMESSEYEKIDELVGSIIRDEYFPDNKLLFLYTSTEDQGIHGPLTILSFSFAGPLNGFNPREEISVSLDGNDISSKIQYEHFINYQRGAAYFRGQYFPFDFIDPSRSHEMKITFNIKNGGVYYKKVRFKIKNVPEVKISLAGFSIDPSTKETMMDRIGVMLYIPETRQFEDSITMRLKDPENWIVEWEDKEPVPEIVSVEGDFGMYTLVLSEKLKSRNKTLSIRVKIGTNLLSEPCKLLV